MNARLMFSALSALSALTAAFADSTVSDVTLEQEKSDRTVTIT